MTRRLTAAKLRELAEAMDEEEEKALLMADGVRPAVGQRVVTVREVAERWHLGHAHDELVHEITSLLDDDWLLARPDEARAALAAAIERTGADPMRIEVLLEEHDDAG